MQRNNVADLFCNGKNLNRRKPQNEENEMITETRNQIVNVKLDWNKSGTNKQIIAELSSKSLFNVDENLQQDFEKLLKYDFEGNTEGSENAVLRLFNAMAKTPEYQLI